MASLLEEGEREGGRCCQMERERGGQLRDDVAEEAGCRVQLLLRDGGLSWFLVVDGS